MVQTPSLPPEGTPNADAIREKSRRETHAALLIPFIIVALVGAVAIGIAYDSPVDPQFKFDVGQQVSTRAGHFEGVVWSRDVDNCHRRSNLDGCIRYDVTVAENGSLVNHRLIQVELEATP